MDSTILKLNEYIGNMEIIKAIDDMQEEQEELFQLDSTILFDDLSLMEYNTQ